jgi:Ca2+-binding RTX toxin-like protein
LESRDNPAPAFDPGTGVLTISPDQSGFFANDEIVALDTLPGLVRVVQNGQQYDFAQGPVTRIVVAGVSFFHATVSVEHLLASTPLTVGRATATRIVLSPAARDLDNVAGRIDVLDLDCSVALFDQAAGAAAEYRIDGEVHAIGPRTFGGIIGFGDHASVDLYVSDAGATVRLPYAASRGSTQLFGGPGADVFTIEEDIPNSVRVAGNGGADVMNVLVSGSLHDALTVTPTSVTWGSPGGLTYSSVETLTVTGDPWGDETFNLDGPFPGTVVTVDGAGGTDTLRGPNTANTWNLSDQANSRVGGVTFRNFERLEGGARGDSFRFVGGAAAWESIDGKGGVDYLDYSLLAAGVSVDLTAGTAFRVGTVTGVENVNGSPAADDLRGDGAANVLVGLGGNDSIDGGGGADIVDGGAGNDSLAGGDGNDLVRAGVGNDSVAAGPGDDTAYGADGVDTLDGGAGNDALFGQAGADSLLGGLGRDLLFGGAAADAVSGGSGDDVVVGGSLASETIQARVDAIRAEWTSAHSYANRVANLRGDAANSTTYAARLNGTHFLTTLGTSPTVTLPAAPEDALAGGWVSLMETNRDWFFGLLAEFADRQSNELVNG